MDKSLKCMLGSMFLDIVCVMLHIQIEFLIILSNALYGLIFIRSDSFYKV